MQTLEIIGTLVGLLYLYFEYKASIWLWAASIVMPAIYIFVYRDAGFYADMGINVYYLLASGYGWAMWMRRSRRSRSRAIGQGAETDRSATGSAERSRSVHAAGTAGPETAAATAPTPNAAISEQATAASASGKRRGTSEKTDMGVRPISRTPVRRWLPLAGAFLAAFGAIAFVLIRWTDSTVPYGDSFITAMSIVGMWMLAQKYVEQWLVWIAVDVVCTGLYLYKGLYPTAGLYALYTVIAVFGYFKWLRLMKTQNAYV